MFSDKDTAKEIIYQYENASQTKKFIFAVTIEAHLPYTLEKYTNYDMTVTSSNYSEGITNELQAYAQGIYDFDQSLSYLVNYFSNKEEPVMLVVYGDHLPPLHEIYETEYQENIEKYSTPYLIWTNYETEIEKKQSLSLPALSMYVMENANINLPWYYAYTSQFYKEYPVFTKRYILDKNYQTCSLDIQDEKIENYHILQFDWLYKRTIK